MKFSISILFSFLLSASFPAPAKDINSFEVILTLPQKAKIEAKISKKRAGIFIETRIKNININNLNFKNFKLNSLSLKNAKIDILKNENIKIKLKSAEGKINISQGERNFSGEVFLGGDIIYSENKIIPSIYGEVRKGILKNIYKGIDLENLTANLKINKDNLKIEKAQLDYLGNHLLIYGGYEHNLNSLILKINSSSNFKNFLPLLKKISSLLVNRTFPWETLTYKKENKVNITSSLKINLNKKTLSDYKINISFQGLNYKKLKDISSYAQINKNSLKIKEVKFLLFDIPFKLSGNLDDFYSPYGSFNIESKLLTAQGDFSSQDKNLNIESIVKFENSLFNLAGLIKLNKNYPFRWEGEGKLDIGSLLKIIKELKIPVYGENMQGKLNVKFAAEGNNFFKNLKYRIVSGGNIELNRVNISDIKVDFYQDSETFAASPFAFSLGEGRFNSEFKYILSKNELIFDMQAQNLQISQLKKIFKKYLPKKNFKGRVYLSLYGKTNIAKNNNKFLFYNMDGEGKIDIEDANIWQINFLKGLGEFLFIPDFEDINFSKAYSDITLDADTVNLKNITLSSPQMEMAGEGNIFLKNHELNFSLYPQFNPNLINASEGLKKIITSVLGKAGLVVEIKGTWKKPTYKLKPALLHPFKQLKGILKDIFK